MTRTAAESNAKSSKGEFRPDGGLLARFFRAEKPVFPVFVSQDVP